jgi:hypothetical protein
LLSFSHYFSFFLSPQPSYHEEERTAAHGRSALLQTSPPPRQRPGAWGGEPLALPAVRLACLVPEGSAGEAADDPPRAGTNALLVYHMCVRGVFARVCERQGSLCFEHCCAALPIYICVCIYICICVCSNGPSLYPRGLATRMPSDSGLRRRSVLCARRPLLVEGARTRTWAQ